MFDFSVCLLDRFSQSFLETNCYNLSPKMEVSLKFQNKLKKKDEKKDENNDDGERKVFRKSFTKKKKKIGLPVQFEDNKAKVSAQVRFKPLVAQGGTKNIELYMKICIYNIGYKYIKIFRKYLSQLIS